MKIKLLVSKGIIYNQNIITRKIFVYLKIRKYSLEKWCDIQIEIEMKSIITFFYIILIVYFVTEL